MSLEKTPEGQYRQADLDALSRDQVLELLRDAAWCTREDLLALFIAGEHAQRPRGLEHVVRPHDAEDLANVAGVLVDLNEIQKDHADRRFV